MQARIDSQTVFRLQALTNRPLLRGIDSAINECLDRLEKLEKSRGVTRRKWNVVGGGYDCLKQFTQIKVSTNVLFPHYML